MSTINRLNELLKEGKEILKTRYDPNFAEDGVIAIGFKETVNDLKFTKWQSKTIVFLEKILKPDDFRLIKFKEEVKTNYYADAKIGVGILESLVEDIESNDFRENSYEDNYELEPYYCIESILNKHLNCFFKAYTESPGFIFSFTSIREIVTLFLPTAKTNPLALSSIFTSS